MNTIADYIKFRTQELNLSKYAVRVKTLNLKAEEELVLNTHYGEFYVVDEEKTDFGITVSSDKGFFGYFDKETNQSEFEHSGAVRFKNLAAIPQGVHVWHVLDLSPKTST